VRLGKCLARDVRRHHAHRREEREHEPARTSGGGAQPRRTQPRERVHDDERAHASRCAQRQCESDTPAERKPDDVRAVDRERIEQSVDGRRHAPDRRHTARAR
jgi:hypothetical protein